MTSGMHRRPFEGQHLVNIRDQSTASLPAIALKRGWCKFQFQNIFIWNYKRKKEQILQKKNNDNMPLIHFALHVQAYVSICV